MSVGDHSVNPVINPKTNDAALARLQDLRRAMERQLQVARDQMHRMAGDLRGGDGWSMTPAQVVARLDSSKPAVIALSNRERRLRISLSELQSQIRNIDGPYFVYRWSRYYRVREGKIHSHRKCPTLNDNTISTLLWQHSGDTPDCLDAHQLCSACFPGHAAKRSTPTACPGSGVRLHWDEQPCPSCGKVIARTSAGVIRRHKP